MNPQDKKQVLRLFTYGMYVVTATDGQEVGAGSITWLSQASFEPPLLMVAIRGDSGLHAVIERAGAFAVNVLAAEQKGVASSFFRFATIEDGKINGHAFEAGPETGAPLLIDLPAWCEARVTDRVERGDHTVYVAEVVSAGVRDAEARPMVLRETGWSYGG